MTHHAKSRHERSLNVAFFGHFGSTNSGNESTLLSILSRLRSLSPKSEFCCVCTHPDIASARYGIDAIPITTKEARIWNREIPLIGRVPMAFVGVGAEVRQYARAFRILKGTDVLIVPGTGLLTDAFCLAHWGPYSLLKWTLMAKLRGCRVLVISVGAGPIDRAIGRVLIKAALSLADYRSYRDDASRDCLTGIRFDAKHDPLYPDLAFGFPESMLPSDGAPCDGTRRVVGLGLMMYFEKYSAAGPRRETYAAYLESLATFAAWLLEHDYDICLLLGDDDPIVIDEFRSVVEARSGGYDEERIVAQPMNSVQDVLNGLAASDVVVATRFHNVLLALLLDKPVIAISHHHKCGSLMGQMELSEYCHDIHEMDTNRLIGQFQKLEHHRENVKRTIERGVNDARAALDEQYELLFPSRDPASRGVRRRLREPFEAAFLGLNERIWRRVPARTRDLRPVRSYGAWLHELVSRRADREMYLGTFFLRNRPALELMRRVVQSEDDGARLKIAVLGCSIGVEAYSILWTLRSSRPGLQLDLSAVDISPEAVHVAERGIYGPEASEMVMWPIFDGLTETERQEMFEWEGVRGAVRPWLREGVTWQVGDASDPDLIRRLGQQDVVVANNFLCHLEPGSAERCLRNLVQLVAPGGYLFVAGVDLDVRTKVALDLGWEPIPDLRAEIHDGDTPMRSEWPWRWWGLEPLDPRRPDWETRYCAVFRIGPGGSSREPTASPASAVA